MNSICRAKLSFNSASPNDVSDVATIVMCRHQASLQFCNEIVHPGRESIVFYNS